MRRHLILGTAGHIDHGKTTLVHALTGIDTDRLPEEKRRGITIDLGFARFDVAADIELGIVDVPGHEAFVRNMLAGATGIDLVLFVIAADESVMPQTREHLAIMELLGVRRAVVALTKADLVEAAWLDLVRDEVTELLAPTPLAGSDIVPVSARTGAGMARLVSALADAAAHVPPRSTDDLFRMPIDRVFTVRGTGTVVTGTVWTGTLTSDEHVRIEPAGLGARVRSLQRHGADTDRVQAGERAAIAVAGIDRAQLSRGDTLVSGAGWRAGSIVTARVTVLRDAAAPLRPRQRVRVHIGTAEALGRIGLLERPLEPGGTALLQLRLEQPLLARARDHFVIRSYSPVHTIAGGVVLEPYATKRKRLTPHLAQALDALAREGTALTAIVALRGTAGVPRPELPILTGLTPPAVRTALTDAGLLELGDLIVARSLGDDCAQRIRHCVRSHHATHPLEDGLEREAIRRAVTDHAPPALFEHALQHLLAEGTLVSHGAIIAEGEHRPHADPLQRTHMERLLALFAAAGLQAPDLAELPPDLAGLADLTALLRFLERDGLLVRISHTRFADAAAIARAVTDLRTHLPAEQLLGVADFKAVLGVSRKHLIPLLEYCDRVGITARAGENRLVVAGGAASRG
ncbi:MAG TPA: selenocysteine-specific translation elongation factor [Longimicrobiales bacterium]|nr:selenocysteine-specific translation elongation factor [Longimicrobiales bacterium]